MRRTYLASCVWILVLIVSIAACQSRDDSVWRFGLVSAPLNFDPRFATDAASVRVNALIYDRLVEFDDRAKPIPGIADWTSPSPTHYRFTLHQPHPTFHGGSVLTAADVRASYASVLDPATSSPHRGAFTGIERIEAPNADTVDFYLTKIDPVFPTRLTLGIMPEKLLRADHPFHSQPVGSGGFQFVDRTDESRLRLTRLRDGQLFEFLTVKDPTVRVLKLLRGELSMIQNDLQPELVTYLEKQGKVSVQTAPGTNFTYLGLNLLDPLLQDRRIREAIAYAIDRNAIIDHLWGGAARPATALLPPEHWAGSAKVRNYQHDPQRARDLLTQAGYSADKPLHLSYKTSSDPFRIRVATIIQYQLREVGIDIEIESYDWATFYGDIKTGRFQMFSLSWVGIKSPDIFRYAFHSESMPPQGANRGRFVDAKADKLIEAAEAGVTLDDQAREYGKLQEYLGLELPYIPLWFEDHVFVAREGFTGYSIAADGNFYALNNVEFAPNLTSRHYDSARELAYAH